MKCHACISNNQCGFGEGLSEAGLLVFFFPYWVCLKLAAWHRTQRLEQTPLWFFTQSAGVLLAWLPLIRVRGCITALLGRVRIPHRTVF